MRLLIDTHALIWWLGDSRELGEEARGLIESEVNQIFVSTISVAEMAIKSSVGKLRVPDDLEQQLTAEAFDILPLLTAHALEVARLPLHHRDPFDRLLVAQARCEGLRLMTTDGAIDAYDVDLVPADK